MVLDLILAGAALVAALPYLVGPLIVRATQRMPARPEFEPYDPVRHPLPDDLAAAFGQTMDAVTADGFRRVADLAHESPLSGIQLRAGLLLDAAGSLALVAAVRSTNPRARIAACYVEYPTTFADGAMLSVSNNPEPYVYRRIAGRRIERFPDARDPARLRRIDAALVDRDYAARAREPLEVEADPAGLVRAAMVREYDQQVAAGYLWLDTAIGAYRPTWRGAWAMTWKLLPPMRQIAAARHRRRARALVAALGVESRDVRPIPPVRSSDPLRWNFAVLAGVALLYLFGPGFGGRERRMQLPAGFAVPAEFDAAVRELERLAGDSAVPLVARNADHEDVPTAGVTVALPRRRADALLAAAREPFLARGFLLFIAERGFGTRDDRLALYPRADPYVVMEVMGTNGANDGITTDRITAWLRALEAEQPFVITGIGFDWMEGRFAGPVRDADALARRFHAFCPDIVEQGTGSLPALARELRRTRTLYCWWD